MRTVSRCLRGRKKKASSPRRIVSLRMFHRNDFTKSRVEGWACIRREDLRRAPLFEQIWRHGVVKDDPAQANFDWPYERAAYRAPIDQACPIAAHGAGE